MTFANLMSDLSSSKQKPINVGLLDILDERQKKILSHLPRFAKITIAIAIFGFAGTSIVQYYTGTLPQNRLGLFSLSQPTLGAIIALFLSLFSILVPAQK